MTNAFVKMMFSRLIGPVSTQQRFGAEYTCKVFGHKWNKHAEHSSQNKTYCNRCMCERRK